MTSIMTQQEKNKNNHHPWEKCVLQPILYTIAGRKKEIRGIKLQKLVKMETSQIIVPLFLEIWHLFLGSYSTAFPIFDDDSTYTTTTTSFDRRIRKQKNQIRAFFEIYILENKTL